MMVYFYCEIYSEVRQMTHFYTTHNWTLKRRFSDCSQTRIQNSVKHLR